MNAAIADDSIAISDRRRSGGFFLVGGVIMFFDRAMYAQTFPGLLSLNTNTT